MKAREDLRKGRTVCIENFENNMHKWVLFLLIYIACQCINQEGFKWDIYRLWSF